MEERESLSVRLYRLYRAGLLSMKICASREILTTDFTDSSDEGTAICVLIRVIRVIRGGGCCGSPPW
jgi:hypothetical protein